MVSDETDCQACSGKGVRVFSRCVVCNGSGFQNIIEKPIIPANSCVLVNCGYCKGSGEIGIGMKCDVCKGVSKIMVFHEKVECVA